MNRILKKGSTGTDVMEIQSVLKKLGYYNGDVDGIYGSLTENAVIEFQKDNNLVPDGIIGPLTYAALEKYILGFFNYTVQPGDTLYSLSQDYNSTTELIISANPDIDPFNLEIGSNIVIPFDYEIVPTDVNYTYEIMQKNIFGLTTRYPFIELQSIGESVLGRELYVLKLGNGDNVVHYNASHHSLEWITSVLLMKFIERISYSYINSEDVAGYNIADIFENSTIYIVPMVNPDGIDLVNNGLDPSNPYYDQLIEWNDTGRPFDEVWQANIRGVDLNHNYDALWEVYKEVEESLGITGPAPTRYGGESPESEPESSALANFTRQNDFRLVLAYHSQGEVIYWNFENKASPEAKSIGEAFAEASGYKLDETYGPASYAGYKDWFIDDFEKPGYTIEVGLGKNPLPIEQFDKIYADNEELLLLASVI